MLLVAQGGKGADHVSEDMSSPTDTLVPLILDSLSPSHSLVGGLALSLAGAFLLFINTALFAIFYSIGVVLSLVGTGFLIGFMKQFKQMFKPVRVVATIVLLVSFVLVWVAAFAVDSAVSRGARGMQQGLD